MTYFLSRPRNVFNFEESSRRSLSEGTTVPGGVEEVGLGVVGLELGLDVAGVAKGVFEVEVMVYDASRPLEEQLACAVSKPMRLSEPGFQETCVVRWNG